jgi:hypothetical protein
VFIAQFPFIKKVQNRDLTTRLRGRPRNRRKEKGEKKAYITERNERSSWEQQEIITFCTCQCNE